jgi:DNA methylase
MTSPPTPAEFAAERADAFIPERLYGDDLAEIWHADSLNFGHVLAVMDDRKADLLCLDAPYSEKTHKGHAGGKMTADRAAAFAKRGKSRKDRSNAKAELAYAARKAAAGESGRRDIDYQAWSLAAVDNFVALWVPRSRGWVVSITDDLLAHQWQAACELGGLYPFAPLPLVETGSRVRMTGDGPSGWTCWVVVARPRGEPYSKWGTLDGAYVVPGERAQNSKDGADRIVGGKPKSAMLAIVGDYSRVDDLVCDPTCGAATTGIAALRLGRRFIGIEKNRSTAELAAEIIKAERQDSTRRRMIAGQEPLFGRKETGT